MPDFSSNTENTKTIYIHQSPEKLTKEHKKLHKIGQYKGCYINTYKFWEIHFFLFLKKIYCKSETY